jgi:hypothetical protein
LQLKHLQPWNPSIGINTLNNIIHNSTPPCPLKKNKNRIKQATKFGEGYLYNQSEDDFVDVYAQ